MDKEMKETMRKLTLQQKASLCSGKDFWNTEPIASLGISAVPVADGPHGLRKQEGDHAHRGLGDSKKATCFPPACLSACSFDVDLYKEIGEAIAEESKDQNIAVVLGPAVNIKRSPLCGRNFEYISEDPYLTGELASSFIQGVQSRGVGTSIKHYAANNQETARMINDSIIDERALREIYLAGFERAIKEAKPWTVMCSYNLINGTYACENNILLNDILRKEWGFEGLVMTDWAAMNDRVASLKAGLDLEMPGPATENDMFIVDAVKEKKLNENVLDTSVRRVLELVEKKKNIPHCSKTPYEDNRSLAARVARESMVLLKNENVLPIDKNEGVAIIGEFAVKTRYQGSGSSRIHPTRLKNAFDAFEAFGKSFVYADGYSLQTDKLEEEKINEAVALAEDNKNVIIFAGLPDEYESEAFDRTHMDLPKNHTALIERVSRVNENVVVVLYAGAPVTMPWIDQVKAVVMAYLPGQEGAALLPELVYGDMCPCGKLAESFPQQLSDTPCASYFANRRVTEYRESIFVGYRYYDTAQKEVLFPFGHGLSYSKFEYKNLSFSSDNMDRHSSLNISLDIENVGEYDAKEIAQLYISCSDSKAFRPEKELKGFKKVYIPKGQTVRVSFDIDMRSIAIYNVLLKDWYAEPGQYIIRIGASSKDIRLNRSFYYERGKSIKEMPDYSDAAPVYYNLKQDVHLISKESFEVVYGKKIVVPEAPRKGTHTINSTVTEVSDSFHGRIMGKVIRRQHKRQYNLEPREDQIRMMEAQLSDMPIRALVSFSDDKISRAFFEGVITVINGRFFKGWHMIFKALRHLPRKMKK